MRTAFILLLLTAPLPAAELTGRVVGVTDGDTITVLDTNKVQHKIRLEGIDAPESKQAFGTKAKQALSDRVFGKEVRVEWKGKDPYGRILGHVHAGKDHVNLSMVRDGFAWHFKRYNKDQKLADAEVEAREAGRGFVGRQGACPAVGFQEAGEREGGRELKRLFVPEG
ncbi:MAG: thermonuclease family protein [Planctomycetaceae bacterium]|nr:thermonuclease family protein [Planctomycetaceae bacterium]